MIDSGHELSKNTSGSMDLLDQDPTINLTMLRTHNLQNKCIMIPWSLMLQIITNPILIKIKKNKKNPIQGTQPKEKSAMDVAKKTISKKTVIPIIIKFLETILLQPLKNIILMQLHKNILQRLQP